MKKLLFLTFLVMLVTWYNVDKKELSYSEIARTSVNEDIQKFLSGVEDEHGVYLVQNEGKSVFIFLNGAVVQQGSEGIYFSDFDVKDEGDTVSVYFNEHSTADYSDKQLNHQVLYKVKLDKAYEHINVFRNGEETYFDGVSG